ncbi:MAG: penicillin-binding protein activator LpoB, partial [Spirochaetales bacterium]|nr:penicillin-binding protein activator LpoB [Spirochaetales bacterium]
TAETIVSDCLSRFWLDDFIAANGERPVVIVGSIRNRSSEHIEVLTFVKDIEKELINSGRVRFVASSTEREEVRAEREDQQSNATEETAKALAAETGADYMMQGVITSITDAIEGKRVVRYQVSMELIHLETNEKAWIGSNEVRKFIEQSKSSW